MNSKIVLFSLVATLTMALGVQQQVFAEKNQPTKKQLVTKKKAITSKQGNRIVLYANGEDGAEKISSARQNHKVAMEMLQEAIKMGHVVQDKNGMYVKKCDADCTCLPIVPSAK